MSDEVIVDVRTREEFYKEHIKGAINISLHDIPFYVDFLKGKKVLVYCNTGIRSEIAKNRLNKEHIDVDVLDTNWEETFTIIKNNIISAVNYLEIRPDKKEEFLKNVKKLCQMTNEVDGFLGSKLLKISGITGVGSFLPSDSDLDFNPDKFIIITYWKDKESHNKSHHLQFFKEIYDKLPEYSSKMPYEEFYEVLK